MAEVVGAEAAFYACADQGVFPGGFDAADRFFAVVDDRAGFVVRFPPGFEFRFEAVVDGDVAADHAAFFGGDDLDGAGVPVDRVPGEAEQLHGAGADAQVVAQLDEAHEVGLGVFQYGPGFGHGRGADVDPLGPGLFEIAHRVVGDQGRILAGGPVQDRLHVGQLAVDGGVLDGDLDAFALVLAAPLFGGLDGAAIDDGAGGLAAHGHVALHVFIGDAGGDQGAEKGQDIGGQAVAQQFAAVGVEAVILHVAHGQFGKEGAGGLFFGAAAAEAQLFIPLARGGLGRSAPAEIFPGALRIVRKGALGIADDPSPVF